MSADPFGTAALRSAVLDAWRSSPTRAREDANLEEDHARGYYRDRVVVELVQNAADAATRAGVPGRVAVHLDDTRTPATLRVAGPGAPLDARGVAALASLRASAKGAGDVGRFGVGFTAVRSVADEVTIRSSSGGVRFSADLTRAELERAGLVLGGLTHGPAVLRLPFPASAVSGDTVVELTLRDDEAVAAVRGQLAAVDDALLLALPTLESVEITVDDDARVLDAVDERWTVRRAAGSWTADDVADLPAEQRDTAWSLVWALPSAVGGEVPRVLHAPTPTDVPLTFPALLVASFPVDPGRRRVLPGQATDRLTRAAGRAYADLLADVAAERGPDVLDLVPSLMPASELDAAVRDAALEALADAPLLDGVAPRDAVLLAGPVGQDPDVAAVLGTVSLAPRHHAVARRLGAHVMGLADLLDELAGLPPQRWRAVYAALASHVADPTVREALAGAPVPLADGRTARGARGLVLPEDGGDEDGGDGVGALGLRVVHPHAAHPVLTRVGATPFDAATLLADPTVRATALDAAATLLDAHDDEYDDELEGRADGDLDGGSGARAVVDAVLRLVADVRDAQVPFWTGELPVAADGGVLTPLRETALPGTWAAEHLDLAVVDDDIARYGRTTLAAAGAHTTLDVYRVDRALTPGADDGEHGGPGDDDAAAQVADWLADWPAYLAYLAGRWGGDVLVEDLAAIADLDAVADGSWPSALARLAGDPALRAALLTPVRPGAGASPGATPASSYAAWWLGRRFGAPFALRDGVPLLPPAPAVLRDLDAPVLGALGGVGSLGALAPEDWPALLDTLGPLGARMALADAVAVWSGLAAVARDADPADRATLLDPLPARLPALDDGAVVVADADTVVVAPGRRWAQLGPVVPVAAPHATALADLLDLPLAAEQRADAHGRARTLDARVAALDPRLPETWRHHDTLCVDGQAVTFWVDEGVPHAVDDEALADALADLLGAPHLAAMLREVLAAPDRAADVWAAVAWA